MASRDPFPHLTLGSYVTAVAYELLVNVSQAEAGNMLVQLDSQSCTLVISHEKDMPW